MFVAASIAAGVVLNRLLWYFVDEGAELPLWAFRLFPLLVTLIVCLLLTHALSATILACGIAEVVFLLLTLFDLLKDWMMIRNRAVGRR